MEDKDKIKQRFELLKMARELLNEDYINKRAEDHNKWIAENDESWRTMRRNVPYPPFAQYPTDEEIVRAATNLYNFIYEPQQSSPIETPLIETDNSATEDAEIIRETDNTVAVPATVEAAEETYSASQSTEHADQVHTPHEPTLDDVRNLSAQVAATKSILPGWIRRTIS